MFRKLRQLLCNHKEVEYYELNGRFYCISGRRIYKRCKKCKKELGSTFYEYEGLGYK